MNDPIFLFGTLLALASPSDTAVVQLEEVVVTGTRIPESAFRTPAAVSIVDRRSFQDSRGIGLGDALGIVPGVLVQSRAGAQDVRVTIRGFGARGNGERSNVGSMRGIRVMTDGIPVTEPDGRTALDLVDLGIADRVEVARSNASTLYGNASGGVVQLRSNLGFQDPYGEFRQRLGSFGYHREQAVAGLALGRARGLVSLLNSSFDGWRLHSGGTTAMFQARLQAPLARHTRLGILLDAVHNLNRFPGALTSAALAANPRQADPDFVARDERRDHRVGRVALSLDHDTQQGDQFSTTLYAEPKQLVRSERNRYRDFHRYHLGGGATWLHRARLAEDLESVSLAGGDGAWQDGSIHFFSLTAAGGQGNEVKADKREAAGSAGFFAQQELRWRERWSMRVATRFDDLRYVSEDHLEPVLDARKTFTVWTPKAAVSYAFEKHTVYAALGGGVEAPAFNEIDPPPQLESTTSLNPFLEATRSTTYEIGARGRLGATPGSLAYDVALYRIDVRNEIVPFAGGAYFFTAGRSRRTGAELGLSWLARAALRLQGALTLSNNEYVDYRNDFGDFGGRAVPGLPRVAGEGSVRYDGPAGLWSEMTMRSVGRYFADDANTARVSPYAILGFTIGAERRVGDASVRAFVSGENLGDRAYSASVFINGVNGEFFEPGLPRSWSGGLTVRWQ